MRSWRAPAGMPGSRARPVVPATPAPPGTPSSQARAGRPGWQARSGTRCSPLRPGRPGSRELPATRGLRTPPVTPCWPVLPEHPAAPERSGTLRCSIACATAGLASARTRFALASACATAGAASACATAGEASAARTAGSAIAERKFLVRQYRPRRLVSRQGVERVALEERLQVRVVGLHVVFRDLLGLIALRRANRSDRAFAAGRDTLDRERHDEHGGRRHHAPQHLLPHFFRPPPSVCGWRCVT